MSMNLTLSVGKDGPDKDRVQLVNSVQDPYFSFI